MHRLRQDIHESEETYYRRIFYMLMDGDGPLELKCSDGRVIKNICHITARPPGRDYRATEHAPGGDDRSYGPEIRLMALKMITQVCGFPSEARASESLRWRFGLDIPDLPSPKCKCHD